MPLTWALSLTVVNWMVNVPLVGATAVNCSTTALYSPPAVAKMSKLDSTCVPSMETLKVRGPPSSSTPRRSAAGSCNWSRR